MGELTKTLSNPYVLAGGAALGLLVLFSASKASGSTSAAASPYTSQALAFNTAALQATTQQAAIAAGVANTRISSDMTRQVATLQAIQNMDANHSQVQKQAIVSNQGIITSQIENSAMVTIDINNNYARLGQSYETTKQAQITSNAAVEIAKTQAKAASQAATMGMIGKVVGTVAAVVAAPFTGGASLMALPAMAGMDSGGNPTGSSAQVPDLKGLY